MVRLAPVNSPLLVDLSYRMAVSPYQHPASQKQLEVHGDILHL